MTDAPDDACDDPGLLEAKPVARYTVRRRRLLAQRIGDLGPTEHHEIFKIVCSNSIEHTQNSNGVFVNLSTIDDAVVDRICKFVDFCHTNKQHLDEYDKRLNECKLSQNYNRIAAMVAPLADPHSRPLHHHAAPAPVPTPAPAHLQLQLQHHPHHAFNPSPLAATTSSARFQQAKKKYAKRRCGDAAAASSVVSDLSADAYVVHLTA